MYPRDKVRMATVYKLTAYKTEFLYNENACVEFVKIKTALRRNHDILCDGLSDHFMHMFIYICSPCIYMYFADDK